MKNNIYLYLIIFLHFFSCKNLDSSINKRNSSLKNACDTTKKTNKVELNKKYKHDANIVKYTVEQWIRSKDYNRDRPATQAYFFQKYYTDTDSLRAKVYVDSLFYNADSTRIFAFVIFRYKARLFASIEDDFSESEEKFYTPIANQYLFDARAVIGYLDTNQIDYKWKLYPFNPILFSNSSCYTDAKESLEWLYFKELKNRAMPTKSRTDIKYNYLLNEPDFWTEKNVIWQKGLRIPNYYNFETAGNVDENSDNPIILETPIKYPDSLLKKP